MLFCGISQSSICTVAVSKYLHITDLCKAISEMAASVVEACPVAFADFIPWRLSTVHYFLILFPGKDSLAIVLRTSVLVHLNDGFFIYLSPGFFLLFLSGNFFCLLLISNDS